LYDFGRREIIGEAVRLRQMVGRWKPDFAWVHIVWSFVGMATKME
jgi:hypothetical protein